MSKFFVASLFTHNTGADVFIKAGMFVCNSTFTYINRVMYNDIFRKYNTGIHACGLMCMRNNIYTAGGCRQYSYDDC